MKKTGTDFVKPYSEKFFGKSNTVQYIYPREEMVKEAIFPYFVLDGGAFNLACDRFGKVDGDDILEKVMSDELFEEFILGGKYNWEKSFAYTGGTGFTRKFEWQIWPQRLYMILPLAHAYMRTGDRRYSDKWLETVHGWVDAHPYQEFDDSISYFETDMVWRDMQVGWRTLSLLHSLFMLQEAPYPEEEWKFLYDLVHLHAKHLYLEAKDRIARQHVQNHVLQLGTALMLAAVMFPEFDFSEEMLEMGKDTVKMNMQGIYPEGGSDEDSPSYSHFIARLYLEAYLLLKNNNLPQIDGLHDSIVNQYRWIWLNITPIGNVPRISDSYSIDSVADIERVKRLIDLDLPSERTSVFFPANNYAVLRKGDLVLYVDALDQYAGHRHWGRPQILLYCGKTPVLVDGGCCNYDRWEMYLELRSMPYHNVVYSPLINIKNYERGKITSKISHYDGDSVAFEAHISYENVEYDWKRTLRLTEDKLIIDDCAVSDKEIPWRSHLLFSQQDTNIDSDNQLRQMTFDYIMTMTTDLPYEKMLMPVMNDNNKIDYAVVAESNDVGKEYRNHIELSFEKREIK